MSKGVKYLDRTSGALLSTKRFDFGLGFVVVVELASGFDGAIVKVGARC